MSSTPTDTRLRSPPDSPRASPPPFLSCALCPIAKAASAPRATAARSPGVRCGSRSRACSTRCSRTVEVGGSTSSCVT
eukprot:scaffold27910_cov78-Isochrysis_galbana.AAC.2